MQIITDRFGRNWHISITIGSIREVKAQTGFDLLGLGKSTAEFFAIDYLTLADVIWILCKEQADKAGISIRDFENAFSGDSIDSLQTAFYAEWFSFFGERRRNILQTAFNKLKEAQNLELDKAEKNVNELTIEDTVKIQTAAGVKSGD